MRKILTGAAILVCFPALSLLLAVLFLFYSPTAFGSGMPGGGGGISVQGTNDNDTLLWNATTGQWEAGGIEGVGGPTGPAGDNGATGAAGDNAYVYVAYASDNTGTGFTTTFDADLDFIAILSTDTAIASPAAGDFAGLWKNYKGATGSTGATGEQGPAGTGDVVGPSSADNNYLVVFDGTTGKALKQFGFYIDNTTGVPILMGPGFGSTALDNTHKGNVGNTTCSNLTVPGDYCFDKTRGVWVVFDNDILQDNVISSKLRYSHPIVLDQAALTDNTPIAGPLDFAQVTDNLVAFVLDNTGKRSGSAEDNVAFNLFCCPASDNTNDQCTGAYNSDQTVTGAADFSVALDSATCAKDSYLRVGISSSNMTGKKLYIRRRFYEK